MKYEEQLLKVLYYLEALFDIDPDDLAKVYAFKLEKGYFKSARKVNPMNI
jgi:hypothetical protein